MRSVLWTTLGVALIAAAIWTLTVEMAIDLKYQTSKGEVLASDSPRSKPTKVRPAPFPPVDQSPAVHADIPSLIAIPALDLEVPVRVLLPELCPTLNPPTLHDAYWVGCRAMPGTDSSGTVFIIGHTVAEGSAVFNDLPKVNVGDDIELTMGDGRLFYRVNKTAHYGKYGEVQRSPEVSESAPGRLVLVTCYLSSDNVPTDENYLVQAQLVGAAVPAR